MNKDKIIKVLESLPQEIFEASYTINLWENIDIKRITFQMKYNAKLVKTLEDANRWKHHIDGNGYVNFIRDDGIKLIMT